MRNIRKQSGGFSLIELMVGVLIAIIASIVMFQVFGFSERQKRTVTGASDAQVNGALALDMIERETRGAGFGGYANPALSNCAQNYTYYDSGDPSYTPGPLSGNDSITQPVTLIDHAASDIPADEITIRGSASTFSANYLLPQSCLSSSMPQSSSELKVASTYGFDTCELMMVVQKSSYDLSAPDGLAGNCTLMQITQVQSEALHIQHNPGSSGPTYNPKVSYQNTANWPAYKSSASGCEAVAVCVRQKGAGGDEVRFAVTENAAKIRQLVMTRDGTTSTIAPHIMDLQAEYGLITTASGTPTWQAAVTGGTTVSGQTDWTTSASHALTSGQIKAIKAVRIALVARSGEFEKPVGAAGTCETTTGDITYWNDRKFDTSKWPTSSTDPSIDWRCYRYKVFETVIPLRNVIWSAT